MKTKIFNFIKHEIVFIISAFMAIISMFFLHPNKSYIDYIDFRVLALLLSLMLVIAGFQKIGTFVFIGNKILSKTNSSKQIIFTMVLLCFFSSMFLTNDVALITFVPFSILILSTANMHKFTITTIVLQTIAANLGSMLTPLGNPQNLYIYSIFNVPILTFLKIMLPYTAISLLAILIFILFLKKDKIKVNDIEFKKISTLKQLVYISLFSLCILSVLHKVDYILTLFIVIFSIFILDKKILISIDYILLLTFVCFFVFIGNMSNLTYVKSFVENLIEKKELVLSIILSQFISNVPAAILLSKFTANYKQLLIGVNIGGLGTLIASLASLISYKYYIKTENSNPKKYLFVFSVVNIVFIFILLISYNTFNF